jgi:biopolymer transport protein ExbB/TolQ
MEFRIDFLKPGRAFPKDTFIYRFKKKLQRIQAKASDQLIRRVGTSITTLVISFAILISSSAFFYLAVYRPRQKRLENQIQEIRQLESLVNSLKKKRKQEQARRDMIKARINQLMRIKNETVSWTDKLRAINRNLVKGIWLTSLEVKQMVLKPKQKAKDKIERRRRRRTKKEKEKKPKQRPPSQIRVSISGATYAFLGSKPLKLIAKFMTDLMKDPVWEKDFDLTDWIITTSEVKAKGKGDEDLTGGLKTVSFKLELERKQ